MPEMKKNFVKICDKFLEVREARVAILYGWKPPNSECYGAQTQAAALPQRTLSEAHEKHRVEVEPGGESPWFIKHDQMRLGRGHNAQLIFLYLSYRK